MKKTAVDFLIEQLSPYICFPLGESAGYNLQDVFDRAKEMEKNQLDDAYIRGVYYNKTFKDIPLK